MNNLLPLSSTKYDSKLISSDLVPVKPQGKPSGKLFYMDNWIDENIINEKLLKSRSEKIKKILNLDESI